MLLGDKGQGGITRRADGRLQVSVTLLDGTRIYAYVPKDRDAARQRRLAAKKLKDLVEIRERDLEPERQTVAVYLRSWIKGLRDAKRRKVRDRTLEHYEYIVEDYIIPALGGHRLDRLSERHIQAWLDDDTGAARSVHHHRAVLRRALNVAKRQRIIAHNPAIDVELPDLADFEGDPLTTEEAKRLVAVPGRLAPLWRLALATGLRQSELLGLAWDNLDLDRGTVTVHQQLVRHAGAWGFAKPKAARTLEVIAIDPRTVEVMREHQRAMAEERTPEWEFFGLVFVTPKGQPLGRSEVLRAFHAACDATGIPRRRFHDLRGSNATLMAEIGVSEPVRQARLGHSTTRMARHYAQVREGLDREAADALGRLLA